MPSLNTPNQSAEWLDELPTLDYIRSKLRAMRYYYVDALITESNGGERPDSLLCLENIIARILRDFQGTDRTRAFVCTFIQFMARANGEPLPPVAQVPDHVSRSQQDVDFLIGQMSSLFPDNVINAVKETLSFIFLVLTDSEICFDLLRL